MLHVEHERFVPRTRNDLSRLDELRTENAKRGECVSTRPVREQRNRDYRYSDFTPVHVEIGRAHV